MILASGSPRRVDILAQVGIACEVRPQEVDERPRVGEHPLRLVERLARLKCQSALDTCLVDDAGEIVLAADTIVWLDGLTLGKPKDRTDARRMLRELSGHTHHVSTGVCHARVEVVAGLPYGELRSFVETTDVSFFELSDEEIDAYVATGEPLDKAGAYGYQARGCKLVERIVGDYYNVVGLPIGRLLREMNGHGQV